MCSHDRVYFFSISSVWAWSYLAVDPLSRVLLDNARGLCVSLDTSGITLRKAEDVEKRRGFRNPLATKRAVERR